MIQCNDARACHPLALIVAPRLSSKGIWCWPSRSPGATAEQILAVVGQQIAEQLFPTGCGYKTQTMHHTVDLYHLNYDPLCHSTITDLHVLGFDEEMRRCALGPMRFAIYRPNSNDQCLVV